MTRAAHEFPLADDALSRIIREHHAPLVTHVQGRVRSPGDAEDIVQETWIRAMARIAEEEEQGAIRNLRAFLYRIAGNLSIDHLRRRKVRAHLEAGSIDDEEALQVASQAPLADAALIAAEQQRAFEAALRGLPARARKVLLLSRVEGWTYPRIAEALGISLRTVSNDIERALALCLSQLIERED
ncbi:RNA polymerase sigma factor [Sphingomonas colocasiae]|uniref:RNA polymerase sigma factor n=1 Tax=Sphingomonas colocasiae TaxID=1848973 RepID=A0ABS7PV42_9SPHN|nr:RNA polymerase sigma factor [Sphingomonas colocasiae]MBY8825219.1 RNA polymerase sigma factor [Sphingomonas colocasiae]